MKFSLLKCPDCHKTECIELRPWKTDNEIFGAVSSLCTECDEVRIFVLSQGIILDIGVEE